MTLTSVRDDYALVLKSATGHAEQDNPFKDWERRFNDFPAMALSRLGSAVLYAYCGMPEKIVATFLNGAIGVSERVVDRPERTQFPREWNVYDDRTVQVLQMAMIKHCYVDGRGRTPDWPRYLRLMVE